MTSEALTTQQFNAALAEAQRGVYATDLAQTYVMYALEPVWVPHPADYVPKTNERAAHHGGPNGELPESGKWRLRYPDGHIHDGPTISPSALDTGAECLNKWGLDRLDGLEKPENHSADLGTLCHGELEAWQKYGTRPTIEGMSKVIEQFPMPGNGEAECHIGFVFGRPGHEVVFAGYVDARVSAADEAEWTQADDGVLEMAAAPLNSTVWDLKTTGDFRWKKTPAQLQANIQSAIYSFGEMLRVEVKRGAGAPGTEVCILKWVYALRKENSKTKALSLGRVETVEDEPGHGTLITRDQAVRVLAQYLPLAERLVEAIQKKQSAKDMPKNTDACASYGGCPWKKLQIDSREVDGVAIPVYACEPPAQVVGGGFKALRKQEMARLGQGESGPSERVLIQIGAVQIGAVSEEKTNNVTERKMTTTGLGARFGKKMAANGANGANGAPAAVQAAPVAVVPPPAAAAAAPVAPTGAGSGGGGLGARFGVRSGAAATGTVAQSAAPAATAAPAVTAPVTETPKLEQKATADGMASTPTPGQAPAAGTGTLAQRLAAVNAAKAGGASAGAITAATSNAPLHAVTGAVTGQLAVGINPPDAAPEWTAEEQAAEAARLAGAKPAAVEGAATEAVTKRGRGRPAGSVNKPAEGASAGGVVAATGDVLPQLDAIVMQLSASGNRNAAAVLMRAAADLSAIGVV